jgi:hypothetical protein
MILNLFRRTPRDRTIAGLYGAIVAQATPYFTSNSAFPIRPTGGWR